MRIIALLTPESLPGLRRATNAHDTVTGIASIPTPADLADADAAVIDPAVVAAGEWPAFIDLMARPGLPVLLYSALDRGSLTRVIEAATAGAHDVVLRGAEDETVLLRARLETLRTPAPPARVLTGLAGHLSALPDELKVAAVPLFCGRQVPRWTDELSHRAGISRRTIDRWILNAGLAGAKPLLDVARLARTWTPIVEQETAPHRVAIAEGFERTRMLNLHAVRVTGLRASQWSDRLSVDAFVSRLVAHAIRRPAPRARR
jgi:hypothetical protein